MIVKLSVLQQISIEGIIRGLRGKDDEEMMTNLSLLRKVRIPKEERPAYVREFETAQGTQGQLLMKSIIAAQDSEIDLETAEIRRLQAILRDAVISVEDLEWKHPLEEMLRKADMGVVKSMDKKKKLEAV